MRPTKMRVSVNTLVENAKVLRADVPEQVKLLWVVKADGYGHGAITVAQRLEQNGCVRSASVTRVLPGTLQITITEREVAAVVVIATKQYCIV